MKILDGTVVEGRVELPAGSVSDGTEVKVLIPEGEANFELSEVDVRQLQVSIDQVSRGEVIDGRQLLAELPG